MSYVLTMQSAYSVWIDGDTLFRLLFDYGSMLCLFAVPAHIAVRTVNNRKEWEESSGEVKGCVILGRLLSGVEEIRDMGHFITVTVTEK